jgi:hypothetical protein
VCCNHSCRCVHYAVPSEPWFVLQITGSLDAIAAALAFNKLTIDQGYDAFDADEDGKVSLKDLLAAENILRLGISESSVQALFDHLDPDKLGYISRDHWKDALASAKADHVLRECGLTAEVSQPVPQHHTFFFYQASPF